MNNRLDFTIVQGETFDSTLLVLNDDGLPIDLTGAKSLLLSAKNNVFDDDLIIELTLGSGITITDAVNGEIRILIPASDTSEFSFKTLYYDLFYSVDGVTYKKYKKGVISLERSITQI